MKKDYFTSLKEKHTTKNKYFWEAVKPFLSNNIQSSERLNLPEEDDTLITKEEDVTIKLNDFFSNATINLKIPKCENFEKTVDYSVTSLKQTSSKADTSLRRTKSFVPDEFLRNPL